MLAGKPCMRSYHFALIQNVQMLALAFDLHGLADQSEGDRVAVGIDTRQIVAGDDAGDGALQAEARLAATGDELRALTLEAVDGPLVRGVSLLFEPGPAMVAGEPLPLRQICTSSPLLLR